MRAGLFFLAVALVGCWKGGTGTPVTSIDGNLVIGALDDAQFARLCRDIDHWNQQEFGSAQFRAAACEIEAAAALRQKLPSPSEEHEACRAGAQACQSARAGSPAVPPQCQRDPSGCPLRVAEIENCLFELSYDLNVAMCTAPVCDDICSNVDPRAVQPPSCAAITVACPGLRFTRPTFAGLVTLAPCTAALPRTRQCVWH